MLFLVQEIAWAHVWTTAGVLGQGGGDTWRVFFWVIVVHRGRGERVGTVFPGAVVGFAHLLSPLVS